MKLGFLGIVLVFLTTVVYVTWHLWRLTPGGWALKLAVAGFFILWMIAYLYLLIDQALEI